MNHSVKIVGKEYLAYNVLNLRLEKPRGYAYAPGQATELAVDIPHLKGKSAPFTFTNLDEEPTLELVVRIYDGHGGITKALSQMEEGDEVMITNAWDSLITLAPECLLPGAPV